jgi:putative flippase GtrA
MKQVHADGLGPVQQRAIGLPRFMRFALVGAFGFVVDGGVLQALLVLGWGPIAARAVAVCVAVLATWALNRSFTFPEAQGGPALASLVRYAGVSAVGASINFAVYTGLVMSSNAMSAQPLLALAVASVIALIVNYLGSKHFAFRR